MRLSFNLSIVFLTFFFLASVQAQPQTKAFAKSFELPGGLASAIIIVGPNSESSKINKLLEEYVKDAWTLHSSLTNENLNGLGNHEKKSIKAAKKIGADIKPIIPGIIADKISSSIANAGFNNSMIKIGFVFKGMGESLDGQWKVQLQDDTGTFAMRAMTVTIKDASISILSRSSLKKFYADESNNTNSKGAVALAKDGIMSNALAFKALMLSPKDAVKMLESMGYRGMVVDDDGGFIRTDGF